MDSETVILFIHKTLQVFKYGAVAGFLVTTTLIINLNNKAFNSVFKGKTKSYFWFFLLVSLIPLLVFIYIFSALFGKLSLAFSPE